MTPATHDLIIMGGGLAGLTLALQLRQRLPGIDVLMLERRTHPVPEACHKVGESSVEIGGHYFQHVLGLEQHLVPAQRAGTPEEVAALAAFLAGPEAAYITGQVISVNGGLY